MPKPNDRCPICGIAVDKHYSTSRYDNKTRICPRCGTMEACLTAYMRKSLKAAMPREQFFKRLGDIAAYIQVHKRWPSDLGIPQLKRPHF